MSNSELTLRFPSAGHVSVIYAGAESGLLPFASPMTEKDRADIHWYVETYGASSLAEPDDLEALRIAARLPEIGKALFEAVFADRAAQRLFDRFQDTDGRHRVLTIDTQNAAILSLPWELLHDPTGMFLFREKPQISVRRRISGATGGRSAFILKPKATLHLLFVVSRPRDAGFIDPRTDPRAVLDALDQYAAGRVTCEFLRPATLNALTERLNDDYKPAIDILHFDGHGVFSQVSEEEAKTHPGRYGRATLSEIQRERQARGVTGGETPVGIGFLLFEKEDGSGHLLSAVDLGENLFRSRIGLVVLSACQSAALDQEGDPMSSVAGRLTSTGIPAILAMTHSVLVATTQALFGHFYQSLARGRGMARALDEARAWLANNPQKYEVRRGDRRLMLELHDWFLPALFHGGGDSALLTAESPSPGTALAPTHNLPPAHEAGFFGRRRELWDIERWFAGGETRRISVTGFGGQGKTELALEAGRWLLRTGLFQRAVFIDYAQVQSDDALGVAVSTLGNVLGQTVSGAQEAGEALKAAPTLILLDNLETVAPQGLTELLDAALAWSEESGARLLLTSRSPDFHHAGYRIEGTRAHRRIPLAGLGAAAYPDDALAWFVKLNDLPAADEALQVPPPRRAELIELFDRVAFHPLSIAVLTQQLRTRSAQQLGQRLEQLLGDQAVSGIAQEGTPPSLIASLRLSLDRLSEEQRLIVGRLGVFQCGAFEDNLLAITGLGEWTGEDSDREQLQALLAALERGDPRVLLQLIGMELPEDAEIPPELLAQLQDKESPALQDHIQQPRAQLAGMEQPAPATPDPWPGLRRQLEVAALIEAERISGVARPFLRFHPTLAPMLWAGLDAAEQARLTLAHRQRYYALAKFLYQQDRKNPYLTRAIALREMPNLLHAVDQALKARDEEAVDFVDSVIAFLRIYGRTREATALNRRAEQAGGEPGSAAWCLAQSNKGDQLLASGQAAHAAECFNAILQTLGEAPSYQLTITLLHLGRLYGVGGRPELAEAQFRRGIAVTGALEQGDQVKKLRAELHTGLGVVLSAQGSFHEAREEYQESLKLYKELDDIQGQGVAEGELGTLALDEGDLTEAVRRFQEALTLFRQLQEPAMEATAQHLLGRVFQKAGQWKQAERHYRESATLKEKHDNLAGAAATWNALGNVCANSGRPEAAETWFRKAIAGGGHTLNVAMALNNLANLLKAQPGRLDEARQFAKEALAIKETLEPGAAEIWTTYSILAEIADQQSRPCEAADNRRLARAAKRRYAGTAHELKRHLPLIIGVLQALEEPDKVVAFSAALSFMEEKGSKNLAAALRKILSGERDADALCERLHFGDSMIVETILHALEDPSTLVALLPEDGAAE